MTAREAPDTYTRVRPIPTGENLRAGADAPDGEPEGLGR
jgi:hypothetical protein